MLEDLFDLGVRMVRPTRQIVISEPIPEPLIKLLQDLSNPSGIQINKFEKLYQIQPHLPIGILKLCYSRNVRLF